MNSKFITVPIWNWWNLILGFGVFGFFKVANQANQNLLISSELQIVYAYYCLYLCWLIALEMKQILCYLIFSCFLQFFRSDMLHHHRAQNQTHHHIRRLCKNSEHVNGEWVYKPELNYTKKAFSCCGEAKGEFLKNREECGSVAYDIEHLFWGSKMYYALAGGSGCWCDIMWGYKSVHPREMYEWVPHDCQLLPFNGSQFCDLLGTRKMLLVGDSSMQQTAATLMSMIVSYGGQCAEQVGFGRSDQLFFSTKGHLNLFQFVDLVKPDICIINSGAHNHDRGDMFSVVESLKNRWGELKASSPHTKYIWKTNNPGHVNCVPGMVGDNASGPKPYAPGPDANDQFQWNLHPIFDEMSRNYSVILNMTGVIDMSPLYLRSDAHWDCLHYCMPGPVNIFSNILLTMMVNKEV